MTAADTVVALAEGWRRPTDPDLSEEYERLFVGPGRVPCPPYESLWRNDGPPRLQGSLLGPCVPDLESCYAGLGVRLAADAAELPDHVAVELEALALALSDPAWEPVARALVCDHLALWAPAFCARVAEETTVAHFRDLAVETRRRVEELDAGLRAPRE
jgi:TorA maturation chaperone TorD